MLVIVLRYLQEGPGAARGPGGHTDESQDLICFRLYFPVKTKLEGVEALWGARAGISRVTEQRSPEGQITWTEEQNPSGTQATSLSSWGPNCTSGNGLLWEEPSRVYGPKTSVLARVKNPLTWHFYPWPFPFLILPILVPWGPLL